MPLKKVQPGQPVVNSASAYNAFVDAALAHQQRQQDQAAQARQAAAQPGVILVKNATGANVDRFAVLELAAPIIPPGTSTGQNTEEFKRQVAMTGVKPTAAGGDNFAITTEPIAKDKIGRALVIGVTPVTVAVTADTADYDFAAPVADEIAKLALSESGIARVLWREEGTTGDKLALIRLAGGGTPGEGATVHWAKARENWTNAAGNDSYVRCWPCTDRNGADPDSSVELTVYLPRAYGSDPNVGSGQVIGYVAAADGTLTAVTGYLDAAIGTVRMWAINSGLPPVGWTECQYGGTGARPSPTVVMNGRFPIGRDVADADYDTVGESGGNTAKVHSHGLRRNLSGANPAHSNVVDEGLEVTTLLTIEETEHRPPYAVVRYIERYDNSRTV